MNTTDSSAAAFRDGMEMIAAAVPGSYHTRGEHGTLLAITHADVPALNPILSPAAVADPAEIAALAGIAAERSGGSPWSIRLRGEPSPEIREIAGRHGLATDTTQPFMTRPLTGDVPETKATVRRLEAAEYETFAAVLAGGFGALPEIVSAVYSPQVLVHPGIAAYLAEDDSGTPVAAGVTIRNDRHLGLGSVATLEPSRRQGHAYALTATMLNDGRAAGAHTAYLHATDEVVPFFEALGFETRETWTMLF
ncbi:GNAT family N-acetyltransferase [Actinoplanes sp. NPDC051513]|uniref:GNAT family N-acetyltransferase n=1 Tax=Actinoplanes sp. NPDC051513 TaxID=3363908 RepID=UPI00379DF7D2